jgi:hypothetical protein
MLLSSWRRMLSEGEIVAQPVTKFPTLLWNLKVFFCVLFYTIANSETIQQRMVEER